MSEHGLGWGPAESNGDTEDEIRHRLLDAAARVFAQRGYDGTRIHDVVREAGLSTGAVYGRFASKDDLLREAVISRSVPHVRRSFDGATRVAELVARSTSSIHGDLSEAEALLLEAYVAARRHDEIAQALIEADRRWRQWVAPLVEAALTDGTVADDVDPSAVLFLVRVLRLGLLLHRASGLPGPEPRAWEEIVGRVMEGFGAGQARNIVG